ncbi:polyprenyl synthetase family protein [Oscillochloris sp. ZM17-4]|uniref:polyprenyl synthetase family protein n=1 Tax=Oscillochloris sp. ZM17-4 TaxID=2866714 RepID=UPI001C73C8DF|nr:polyprenyl synthetase family protein [Oscillochloris sp. ZM17-4]MBX0329049.1 polyprenyl synthetase family protein [Oscillochloris sp. ZM17-4]
MIQPPLPPELAADLQQVEQIVRARTSARAAVIRAADPYLLRPGEDRLRAALVLLSAQVGTYQLAQTIHAAAAIELIHAATRTHNDLVDEAERRLGQTRRGEWNHGLSLMVGDYLFALAAGEMARSPDPRVISYYSQAVMRICESELAPVPALRPLDKAREQYFAHTGGAAAALFSAACQAGAACGGLPADQIEALAAYGHALGLALRVGVELRDFARGSANGSSLAGESLRHGAATLPLIFAAAVGDGDRLELALNRGSADRDWAVDEVRRHGVGPARAEMGRHAEAARAALAGLPAGPARAALDQIAASAASA